ncbi:hypothetical protein P7K49_023771, partial [Saguinus oedipus]
MQKRKAMIEVGACYFGYSWIGGMGEGKAPRTSRLEMVMSAFEVAQLPAQPSEWSIKCNA